MIVVTTPYLAGHRVIESKGMVFGLVVRSRGLGGNLMASLRSLGGGETPAPRRTPEWSAHHRKVRTPLAPGRGPAAPVARRRPTSAGVAGAEVRQLRCLGWTLLRWAWSEPALAPPLAPCGVVVPGGSNRTTTDFDAGWLLPMATASSGTSTLHSG